MKKQQRLLKALGKSVPVGGGREVRNIAEELKKIWCD